MNAVASFPAEPAGAGGDPRVSVPPSNGGARATTNDGKEFDQFLGANQASSGQKAAPQQEAGTSPLQPQESLEKKRNPKTDVLIAGVLAQAGLMRASSDDGTKSAPVLGDDPMQSDAPPDTKSQSEAAPQPDSSGKPAQPNPGDPIADGLASAGWMPVPMIPPETVALNGSMKPTASQAPVPDGGMEAAVFARMNASPMPPEAGAKNAEPTPILQVNTIPATSDGRPLKNAEQDAAPEETVVTATAAKSAGAVESSKNKAAADLAVTMQPAMGKVVASDVNRDGTSPAMQVRAMPDLRFQPQPKMETAHAVATSSSSDATDSAAVVAPSQRNFADLGRDQKNDAGQPSTQQHGWNGLTIRQSPDGAAAMDTASFSGTGSTDQVGQAATVIKHVFEAVERMRSDGQSHVELQVKLKDGTEIAIKLQFRDGSVQPVFKTDSSELRQALERNWNQFSSESTGRGMRVTAPVFESPDMQPGANDPGQHRGQQEHPAETWRDAMPMPASHLGRSVVGRRGIPARQDESAPGQPAAGLELYA